MYPEMLPHVYFARNKYSKTDKTSLCAERERVRENNSYKDINEFLQIISKKMSSSFLREIIYNVQYLSLFDSNIDSNNNITLYAMRDFFAILFRKRRMTVNITQIKQRTAQMRHV